MGDIAGRSADNLILSQIPNKLRRRIWANKLVDLGQLIPKYASITEDCDPADFDLQVQANSTVKLVKKQKGYKFENIDSWLSAFIRYVAVYLSKESFAHEGPALMRYIEIIRDLAKRGSGSAFLHYDIQFRTLRSSEPYHPLPWNEIFTNLWVQAATPKHFRGERDRERPNNRNSKPIAPTQEPKAQTQARKAQFLATTCFKYNLEGKCGVAGCTWKHICGYCEGGHSALHCPTPPNHAERAPLAAAAASSSVQQPKPSTSSK